MKKVHVLVLSIFLSNMFYTLFAESVKPEPHSFIVDKNWQLMVKQQSHHGTNGAGYVKPGGESDQEYEARMLKAAMNGKTKAQYQLGCFYYDKMRFKEAFSWLLSAAEDGMKHAQYSVGVCYQNGEGVEQSGVDAFRWFLKSARQNNPDAEYKVGKCYEQGTGVAPDLQQAVYWWTLAADAGQPGAQYEMGNCCFQGKGVKQDHLQAFRWFSKAAEGNNVLAQAKLGDCYYEGYGTTRNHERAYYWWIISEQNDPSEVNENKEVVEKELTAKRIKRIKAAAQQWLFRHYE